MADTAVYSVRRKEKEKPEKVPMTNTVSSKFDNGKYRVHVDSDGVRYMPAQTMKYNGKQLVIQEVQYRSGNLKMIVVGGYKHNSDFGAEHLKGGMSHIKVDIIQDKKEADSIREVLEKELSVRKKHVKFLT